MSADPGEYRLEFFKELGFERRLGRRCKEAYWTLNPEFDEPQDAPCVEYWFDKIPSTSPMSLSEAREAFLGFFEKLGHERIPPRPVVARWREDLYLTIASIVVFQPHVTSGLVPPPANPLAISQPSIRLEDIDNVGLTIGRHLTTFEMAAHHAFNYPDKHVYWKEETVRYAFEFFTKVLKIPPEMVVFKESWWEGGGNAGPSFEVTVGGLELATLVFMKYKVSNGRYEEIPLKIVDTGYGVERLSWFTMKTPTAFHSIYHGLLDKFRSELGVEKPDEKLLWAAFRAAGSLDPEYPESVSQYYNRISSSTGISLEDVKPILTREARLYSILDHTKTIALMLADGIVPSNSGEGYLARLVIRRAARQIALLGVKASLVDLVDLQISFWASDFPQLRENRDYILEAVALEEDKFRDILRKAETLISKELKKRKSISVEDLVRLYDTMGIPPEIVASIASRRGLSVSVPHNFYSIVASRHRSSGRIKGYGFEEARVPKEIASWASSFQPTRRVFHEDPYIKEWKSKILGVNGRYVVFDSTIFYPTGGGQVSDTGTIVVGGSEYRVLGVEKVGDVIVHVAERDVGAEPGDNAIQRVDWERRYAIMRHHTATHVLIAAARRVLGPHAWQAGAEKTEHKGRLDITHHKPLTREDVERIENVVNKVIRERRRVWEEMIEKNVAEEKYGFVIYQGGVPMERSLRLVFVEGWDVEACFGTHVRNTGEIGGFKIVSYSRIQDGVVRIEYVAGDKVVDYARSLEHRLGRIAETLGASRGQEESRAKSLVETLDSLKYSLRKYRGAWLESLLSMAGSLEPLHGVRILIAEPVEKDRKTLQEMLRTLTSRREDLLAVFIYPGEGFVQVEMASGPKVAEKLNLKDVILGLSREMPVKGGGGRTYASARVSGKVDATKVKDAIVSIVDDLLSQ